MAAPRCDIIFELALTTMPHQSTWRRVLGQAVDVEQLEQVLGQFFVCARVSE